jgi:hypothetical protein
MAEETNAGEGAKGLPLPLPALESAVELENKRYPIPPASNMVVAENPWFLRVPAIAMWGLAVYSLYLMKDAAPSREFIEDAYKIALSVLASLFVVALFVERAQQIFVGGWRGVRRAALDRRVTRWQAWRTDVAHYPVERELQLKILEGLNQAELDLAIFRQRTRKFVFMLGLSLGVLIAATGPRILAQIVEPSSVQGFQGWVFALADILITGGLIGGGSEAIHKIMVLITDTLDQTRKNVTGK